MKLKEVILQLDKKDYSDLVRRLKIKNAEKYLLLLSLYRQNKTTEQEILIRLNVSPASFYTLKSRLSDKVQEFLYLNTSETRIQLLQNVANIENLVYKTPKETAIGLLKKLEIELIKLDMPSELIIVYKALRKLHLHSQKYFEYSQLYNKSVAFNLAQDKAEELLSSFCKTLSAYYLNKNEQLQEILLLYKKEMANLCKLYESHHLQVYQNILDIHFALFSDDEKDSDSKESIEKRLLETYSIIDSHRLHKTYQNLELVLDFLSFEFYFKLKMYEKVSFYNEKLIDNYQAISFCNHSSFSIYFFISKIKLALVNKTENKLIDELVCFNVEPIFDDIVTYILLMYYKASSEFYSRNYEQAIKTLSKLSNEINFIDNPIVEIEIKLFLALLFILEGSHVTAESLIRSVYRKVLDGNDEKKYQSPITLIKLLKVILSPIEKNKSEKIAELIHKFNHENGDSIRFLEFLKLNELVSKRLLKFGNGVLLLKNN